MDAQFAYFVGGIAATGIFGTIGWVFKMIFSKLHEHETAHKYTNASLAAHKLHAAETFATKTDVDRGFDRIMSKLETMDDKLDKKVDK